METANPRRVRSAVVKPYLVMVNPSLALLPVMTARQKRVVKAQAAQAAHTCKVSDSYSDCPIDPLLASDAARPTRSNHIMQGGCQDGWGRCGRRGAHKKVSGGETLAMSS